MIASLLLTACRTEHKPTVETDGYDLDDVVVIEEVPDAPEVDTTETPEETAASHVLEVCFTSAWSASVPFLAGAGETVNLGAYMFRSVDGIEMNVADYVPTLYLHANPEEGSPYMPGEDDDVQAEVYVPECLLRGVVSRAVYMGPINTSNEGPLAFTDDFTIPSVDINDDGMVDAVAVNLECAISPQIRESLYGVATDIDSATDVVAEAVDGGMVDVRITGTNTNEGDDPRVAAIISPDE